MVPPHGSRRYTFVPRPSGTRWYHTHVFGRPESEAQHLYGAVRFPVCRAASEPGQYDAEVFLALHGWDPYLGTMGDEGTLDVIYQSFSINSHALGYGEPVRVKEGQKVMLRVLNASATDGASAGVGRPQVRGGRPGRERRAGASRGGHIWNLARRKESTRSSP